MYQSLNLEKAEVIKISESSFGPMTPVKAVLDWRTVIDEPYQQGRAFSLEDNKPYIGSFGNTPVIGDRQKYIQVWDIWFNGNVWCGRTATYRGNNYILGLKDYPQLTRALKKLLSGRE